MDNARGRNFENLRIWTEARFFVNEVYRMMVVCRDYGFRDQIQRAAISIMNNIAEGFECGSDAKFINFLNISKGSCAEVKSMLYLCQDFEYCTEEKRIQMQKQLESITNGIWNLIAYLKNNNQTKQ